MPFSANILVVITDCCQLDLSDRTCWTRRVQREDFNHSSSRLHSGEHHQKKSISLFAFSVVWTAMKFTAVTLLIERFIAFILIKRRHGIFTAASQGELTVTDVCTSIIISTVRHIFLWRKPGLIRFKYFRFLTTIMAFTMSYLCTTIKDKKEQNFYWFRSNAAATKDRVYKRNAFCMTLNQGYLVSLRNSTTNSRSGGARHGPDEGSAVPRLGKGWG